MLRTGADCAAVRVANRRRRVRLGRDGLVSFRSLSSPSRSISAVAFAARPSSTPLPVPNQADATSSRRRSPGRSHRPRPPHHASPPVSHVTATGSSSFDSGSASTLTATGRAVSQHGPRRRVGAGGEVEHVHLCAERAQAVRSEVGLEISRLAEVPVDLLDAGDVRRRGSEVDRLGLGAVRAGIVVSASAMIQLGGFGSKWASCVSTRSSAGRRERGADLVGSAPGSRRGWECLQIRDVRHTGRAVGVTPVREGREVFLAERERADAVVTDCVVAVESPSPSMSSEIKSPSASMPVGSPAGSNATAVGRSSTVPRDTGACRMRSRLRSCGEDRFEIGDVEPSAEADVLQRQLVDRSVPVDVEPVRVPVAVGVDVVLSERRVHECRRIPPSSRRRRACVPLPDRARRHHRVAL